MRILGRLLILCAYVACVPCEASQKATVFVSFSMPHVLLMQTLKDSARLQIPATLNGLHHNSMMETAKVVGMLSNEIPNLSLQIDPTAFERFGVTQVPALVVEEHGCFDVVYGNLPIQAGLEHISRHGECGFSSESLQEIVHG